MEADERRCGGKHGEHRVLRDELTEIVGICGAQKRKRSTIYVLGIYALLWLVGIRGRTDGAAGQAKLDRRLGKEIRTG